MGPKVFTRLFGTGLSAEIVTRAARYLVGEMRSAVDRSDRPVTRVRLQPGETYTVIARPRPTRRERKLSSRQASLAASFEKQTRPSRSQLRAARRLARAQKRVDHTRTGSRRNVKWSERETRRGDQFDRIMRPSKRQLRTAQNLDSVTRELNSIRSERFDGARRSVRPRRSVTLYE